MPVPLSMLMGTRIQGSTGSAFVFAGVSVASGSALFAGCDGMIGLTEGATEAGL